jgi:hypothetical protein
MQPSSSELGILNPRAAAQAFARARPSPAATACDPVRR